jgi:putative ABC transport system substrate-binding protein
MYLSTLTCIMTLALGLLVVPLTTGAQPLAKVPRIGYITDSVRRAESEALRQALRDLGYVEGQTIAFEWRFADTPAQYPDLAAELVGLQVDIIVVRSGFMVRAVMQATRTIPIVMAAGADPVGEGFVASLSRPGGNVTGLTTMSQDLSAKSLELLKTAIPEIARVVVFGCVRAEPPHSVEQQEWQALHVTAQRLGLHLQFLNVLQVRNPDDFEALFAEAVRERADALQTLNCINNNLAPTQIAGLAAKHRLPGMHSGRTFVVAGGLMSYAAHSADRWRRVAVYVDKILKGAKPADLPVEQPVKFDLVINLKTAAALGLTIPPALLYQADEVIQ